MRIDGCIHCERFPCTDVDHAGYVIPDKKTSGSIPARGFFIRYCCKSIFELVAGG